jgi:hypothetical protein
VCELCVERHHSTVAVLTSNRDASERLDFLADPPYRSSAGHRLRCAAREVVTQLRAIYMRSRRCNRTDVPRLLTIARPLLKQTLTTCPSIQAELPPGFQCLGLQLMWRCHAFIDTWNPAAAGVASDVARSVEQV